MQSDLLNVSDCVWQRWCVRSGVAPVRFAAVRCDRPGSLSLGALHSCPPTSSLWHLYKQLLLPPQPPTLTLKSTWLCPAGLPVTAGIVNGTRQTWRVLCTHGHGPRHCLQQCAGLRPQHWRWHGSERHHYCKWWCRRPESLALMDTRMELQKTNKKIPQSHTQADKTLGVSRFSKSKMPFDIFYDFFY